MKNLEQHIRERFTPEYCEMLKQMEINNNWTYNRKDWESSNTMSASVWYFRKSPYLASINIKTEGVGIGEWEHPLDLAQAEKDFPLPPSEWTKDMMERFRDNLWNSERFIVHNVHHNTIIKNICISTQPPNDWVQTGSGQHYKLSNSYPPHFTAQDVKEYSERTQ